MNYIIMCYLSHNSGFGAAEAPLSANGYIRVFTTKEDAEKVLHQLFDAASNPNLSYTVEEQP